MSENRSIMLTSCLKTEGFQGKGVVTVYVLSDSVIACLFQVSAFSTSVFQVFQVGCRVSQAFLKLS